MVDRLTESDGNPLSRKPNRGTSVYNTCYDKFVAIVPRTKHRCSRRVSAESKFIAIRVPAIRHVLTKDLPRDACRSR